MDFLSQTFTFDIYYWMVKCVFNKIGYDYYKGLKGKLPPIRFIGYDKNNNELVTFAHPRDFIKHLKIFKFAYNHVIQQIKFINIFETNFINQKLNLSNQITNTCYKSKNKHHNQYIDIDMSTINSNVKIIDVKSEILEIYPATKDLAIIPNGFIALFVDINMIENVNMEFTENDEVAKIDFLHISSNGIDISNIQLCGVIESFIKKFNGSNFLKSKYNGLFLVIAEMKDINIVTGQTFPTNKFNIIGGRRTYDENSIQSTIRETTEELGLSSSSTILKQISEKLYLEPDVIKLSSFNVYCINLE